MGETANTSRRMIARAAWSGASSDEEARAYLQQRLRLMSVLMFLSFVVIIAFMTGLYRVHPTLRPDHQSAILVISLTGVALLVGIWRFALARGRLRLPVLNAIDAFYGAGTGVIFGVSAYLAREFQPSQYLCLIYTLLVVLLRSTVIPSTPRRTAIVSAVTSAPIVVSSIAVATSHAETDLPGPAFVASATLIVIVVILLATVSSRITYGLRRKVKDAMQVGQYTLLDQIGKGGMGTVYRARHAMLRRATAVKLLDSRRVTAEMVDRFEREVQHTSQLTHPNTVAVFDFGRSSDGVFYYAMEYLDGIDLERLVQRFGPQPNDRVAGILIQVCGALSEAHRGGIMHRDVKPANIILCERGGVPDIAKVVDFGLVTDFTANDGASSRLVLGTPDYAAPECVMDPTRVRPAADIYALGAVGYFLLTGVPVFAGKTAVDVCMQHVHAAPVPPSKAAPTTSPELERVILDCLAKDPDARPDAELLATRLRALVATGDWNEAAATRWWSSFHERGPVPAPEPDVGGMTITVDLGDRAAS